MSPARFTSSGFEAGFPGSGGTTTYDYGPYTEDAFPEGIDSGFCALLIKNVKPELVNVMRNLGTTVSNFPASGQTSCNESWLKTLAHIYHYYLRDENGVLKSTNSLAKIYVQVFRGDQTMLAKHDLSTINDMQTQYERAMGMFTGHDETSGTAKERFQFKAEVHGDLGETPVYGVLRYHPVTSGEDSKPLTTDQAENGEESKFTFHCYWNGRLISNTRIGLLPFCNPSTGRGRSVAEDLGSFDRLSGVLFFTYPWEVTQNKMSFALDVGMILNRLPVTDFQRAGAQRTRTANLDREFLDWMNGHHTAHDTQLTFENPDLDLVYIDDRKVSPNGQFNIKELSSNSKFPTTTDCPKAGLQKCVAHATRGDRCVCFTAYTVFKSVKFGEKKHTATGVGKQNTEFLLTTPGYFWNQKARPQQFGVVKGFMMEGDRTATTDPQTLPKKHSIKYMYKRAEVQHSQEGLCCRSLQELIDGHTGKAPKLKILTKEQLDTELAEEARRKDPGLIDMEYAYWMSDKIDTTKPMTAGTTRLKSGGEDNQMMAVEYGPFNIKVTNAKGEELTASTRKLVKVVMKRELLVDDPNQKIMSKLAVDPKGNRDCFEHITAWNKYPEDDVQKATQGYWFGGFECRLVGQYRITFQAIQPKRDKSNSAAKDQIQKYWTVGDGDSAKPLEKVIHFVVRAGGPAKVEKVKQNSKNLLEIDCDRPIEIRMVVTDAIGNPCPKLTGWQIKCSSIDPRGGHPTSSKYKWKHGTSLSSKTTPEHGLHFVAKLELLEAGLQKLKKLKGGNLDMMTESHDDMNVELTLTLRYEGKEFPGFEGACITNIRVMAGKPYAIKFHDPKVATDGITTESLVDFNVPAIRLVDKLGLLCKAPAGGWEFNMLERGGKKGGDKLLQTYKCGLDMKPQPETLILKADNDGNSKDVNISYIFIKLAGGHEVHEPKGGLEFVLKLTKSRAPSAFRLVHDGKVAGELNPTVECPIGSTVTNLAIAFTTTNGVTLTKKDVLAHVEEVLPWKARIKLSEAVLIEHPTLGVTVTIPDIIADLPTVADSTTDRPIRLNLVPDGAGMAVSSATVTVKMVAGAPAGLRFDLPERLQMRAKETGLLVSVVDALGNVVQKSALQGKQACNARMTAKGFTEAIDAAPPKIQGSKLQAELADFSIHGAAGPREFTASWTVNGVKLKATKVGTVLAGKPARVRLWMDNEAIDDGEELVAVNGRELSPALDIQVQDEDGNVCNEEDQDGCAVAMHLNEIVLWSPSDSTSPPSKPQKVFRPLKGDGAASCIAKFGILCAKAHGKARSMPQSYADTALRFRHINKAKEQTELKHNLKITLQEDLYAPDSLKVVLDQEELVDCTTLAVSSNGELPDLRVYVRTVGGADATEEPAAPVTLSITNPPGSTIFSETTGVWDHVGGYFRITGAMAPGVAAPDYALRFRMVLPEEAQADAITSPTALPPEARPWALAILAVVAGTPVKLAAYRRGRKQWAPRNMSLANVSAERYFCQEDLTLELQDDQGNTVQEGALANGGKLTISITSESAAHSSQLPELDASAHVSMTLHAGRAVVHRLGLEENTPGKEGQYVLVFQCVIGTAGFLQQADCKVPFFFSDSHDRQKRKQEEIREKTDRIEQLKKEQGDLQVTLQSRWQRWEESKVKRDQKGRQQEERNKLLAREAERVLQVKVATVTPQDIQRYKDAATTRIAQAQAAQASVQLRPGEQHRKVVGSFQPEQGVVGFFGSLLTCEDDDVCLILCSALGQGKKLKVLVCDTIDAANRHKRSDQVLPLQSAKQSNVNWPLVPDNNMKKHGGEYFGNKVGFPHDPARRAKAVKAFNALVGNLMYFPTQNSSNQYRRDMKGRVGTLWSLDGLKVESSGVFGGRQAQKPEWRLLSFAFAREQRADPVPALWAFRKGLERLEYTAREFQAADQEFRAAEQATKAKDYVDSLQRSRVVSADLKKLDQSLWGGAASSASASAKNAGRPSYQQSKRQKVGHASQSGGGKRPAGWTPDDDPGKGSRPRHT